MGNQLGRVGLGRGRAAAWGLVALGSSLLLALAGCGSDDDGPVADGPASTEPAAQETEAGLLPCAVDRYLVAFDIVGFLTQGNLEILSPWANESIPPAPRSGSVELVQTYRQKGYEVLYVTTIPEGMFPGRTVADAVTEWLQTSGFPVGDGTQVWVGDAVQREDGQTWVQITDELLRLASEGVTVAASYTENTDKAFAFATGGVPEENNFTLSEVEGLGADTPTSAPTTLIPNDDLVAHLTTVQQLAPPCQVA